MCAPNCIVVSNDIHCDNCIIIIIDLVVVVVVVVDFVAVVVIESFRIYLFFFSRNCSTFFFLSLSDCFFLWLWVFSVNWLGRAENQWTQSVKFSVLLVPFHHHTTHTDDIKLHGARYQTFHCVCCRRRFCLYFASIQYSSSFFICRLFTSCAYFLISIFSFHRCAQQHTVATEFFCVWK